MRTEQAGDSQYILVSVGTSTQVLQSPTEGPEAVLKAVLNKDFEKIFLGGRSGSPGADVLDFRRTLDRARSACDHTDPECVPLNRALPLEANQIDSRDRVITIGFLSQFRSLIEALARGTGRRSVVLLSDGFHLVPGREAFELLAAYFPEMASIKLSTTDRMPDLEPVLQLAANSNIPIYTVDSRGLYASTFYDASNPGGQAAAMPGVLRAMNDNSSAAGDTLSEIAAATGGTSFQNNNNILNGIERAFADGRQYYVLACVPSSAEPNGKFHSISGRCEHAQFALAQ